MGVRLQEGLTDPSRCRSLSLTGNIGPERSYQSDICHSGSALRVAVPSQTCRRGRHCLTPTTVPCCRPSHGPPLQNHCSARDRILSAAQVSPPLLGPALMPELSPSWGPASCHLPDSSPSFHDHFLHKTKGEKSLSLLLSYLNVIGKNKSDSILDLTLTFGVYCFCLELRTLPMS